MLTRTLIKVTNESPARSVSPAPTISNNRMKQNQGDSQSHPLPSFAILLGLFVHYCCIEQSSFTSPMQNSPLLFWFSASLTLCWFQSVFPDVSTVANHNYRGCLRKFFYTLFINEIGNICPITSSFCEVSSYSFTALRNCLLFHY